MSFTHFMYMGYQMKFGKANYIFLLVYFTLQLNMNNLLKAFSSFLLRSGYALPFLRF